MDLLASVITVFVGALLFKLAVYLISPDSPNSVLRAIITSIAATVFTVFAVFVTASILGPLSILVVAFVAPIWVIKTSYGMSWFRAIIVSVVFGAFSALVGNLVAHRTAAPAPITSTI